MQNIARYFWQLCLFRAEPAHSPGSPFALVATGTVYCLLTVVTLSIGRGFGAYEIALTVATGIAIQATGLYILLIIGGVTRRFLPAMTALFGANSVILLIALPMNAYLAIVPENALHLLVKTLFLAALIWWIAISGFILQRSAKITMLQGVAMAFGIEMLTTMATYQLVGGQD